MRRAVVVAAVAVAAVLAGCASARPPYDPRDACAMAIQERAAIAHGSARDVLDLSYGTPAEATAKSAYAQSTAIFAVGGIGAGALVAGLVMGFVADPTQTAVRNAG